MWKTFEPSGFRLGLDQVLSESVLMQIIQRDFVNVHKFMQQLKAVSIPCFAISTPPPRSDHKAIRGGVNPALASYIDRRYRAYVMHCFAEEGIDVILPPPQTYDNKGFLNTEFCSPRPGDSNHANDEFGALMMKEVVKYLNKRFLNGSAVSS
jgi:hypothetical protein